MSRRIWALLLTALMIASAAVALAPAAHAGIPANTPATAKTTASSTPGAGPIHAIYNGYGDTTTNFDLGVPGEDTLAFSVYDPVDRAVNVTITDRMPVAMTSRTPRSATRRP